jgi:hypothetical protein
MTVLAADAGMTTLALLLVTDVATTVQTIMTATATLTRTGTARPQGGDAVQDALAAIPKIDTDALTKQT